jgi:pilus assembly protein FimV
MLSVLGFYAIAAHALSLSEPDLKSYLNQRLDVKLELKMDAAIDLDDLKVELRNPSDNYASPYHLKYEVLKDGGASILKITSNDVIREPIVEFTLDIGWSDGHIIREYSLLIDPPRN